MPTAGILDSWQSPQAWVRAIGNTLSTVTTGPIEPGLTHGFACVIENPQVSPSFDLVSSQEGRYHSHSTVNARAGQLGHRTGGLDHGRRMGVR